MTLPGEPKPKDLCPCGSKTISKRCCFFAGRWDPPSAVIKPTEPRTGASHPGCFARVLGDCAGDTNREHYVSAGILERIGEDSVVEVSGLRWQQTPRQRFGVAALTARILCTKHNTMLSPLDAAALLFLNAHADLNSAVVSAATTSVSRMFAGADIERWLLKLALGMAAAATEDVPEALVKGLFGAAEMPLGVCLHYQDPVGKEAAFAGRYLSVDLAYDEGRQPESLQVMFWGFPILLTIKDRDAYAHVVPRPHRIQLVGKVTHTIALGWDRAGDTRKIVYRYGGSVRGPHPDALPKGP